MSYDEYDNILFDKTGGDKIINYYNKSNPEQNRKIKGPTDRYFYFNVERITKINGNIKTFIDKHFIFKNMIIIFRSSDQIHIREYSDPISYNYIIISNSTKLSMRAFNTNFLIHNLPINILFCIKNFCNINNYSAQDPFFMDRVTPDIYNYYTGLIKLYQDKPEYFKSEDAELKQKEELIEQGKIELSKEKELFERGINGILIKEKQNELDKLILENKQKINHYVSLEQEIINVQKEKELIKEEKRKIAIVKEKLAQQKKDLDDNKFKFELEKDRINDFDIDKFIKQNNL